MIYTLSLHDALPIYILMNEYKNEEFFFIIGADMVEYLPSWSRIDELVQLVKFVGVQREGYELNSPYPFIKVDIPMIDISSTWIRKRLGEIGRASCRER